MRLRRQASIPILMLTAKSAEADRLRGLALGADDYLIKPFSPWWRVRDPPTDSGAAGPPMDLLVLDDGHLEVDLPAHETRLDGGVVPLTAAEFRLLAALARQPRRVFSRFELLQVLQGPDVEGFERTVDVHGMRLRRKLDDAHPGAVDYITTVYGVGYQFDEPSAG